MAVSLVLIIIMVHCALSIQPGGALSIPSDGGLAWIDPLFEDYPGSYRSIVNNNGYCNGILNCTEKICSDFNSPQVSLVGFQSNSVDYCYGLDDGSLCFSLNSGSIDRSGSTVEGTVYGLSINDSTNAFNPIPGMVYNCTSNVDCLRMICDLYCGDPYPIMWAVEPHPPCFPTR